MGRGLGHVQKAVLRIALEKQQMGGSGQVYARDVLSRVYGFPTSVDLDRARPGALVFDRRRIGVRRYHSASVTVARAFDRLAARGLVERRYGYGVRLTELGAERAKSLL
jgi:hypothetical protein